MRTPKMTNHHRARAMAYVIHNKLWLTFPQCVQLILTNYKYGHVIANRNIRKHNETLHNPNEAVSEFDATVFNDLLLDMMDFAGSLRELRSGKEKNNV